MSRNFVRWLAAIWIVAISAGSLMPTNLKIAFGTTTRSPFVAQPVNFQHRIFHFVAFGVAALLLLILASKGRQELWAVLAVAALGLGLEFIQHFIVGYPIFEWWDVRDDIIGAMVVYLLVPMKWLRTWALAEA